MFKGQLYFERKEVTSVAKDERMTTAEKADIQRSQGESHESRVGEGCRREQESAFCNKRQKTDGIEGKQF